MSAITAALRQLDDVAAEGDLAAAPLPADTLDLEPAGEPIELPDGKHDLPAARCTASASTSSPARCWTWTTRPRSSFLRLIGPPGAGKSQIARAIAYRLWTERGRTVEDRHGAPFYGFVEMQPGPSSDEFFFRHEWVPVAGSGGAGLARGLRVRAGDARGLGGDDRRGQHRPRRLPALDQRHARRPPRALPVGDRRDRDRPARVRASCSPTTPAWSARPTSPTPGTRASRPRSRSPATGRRCVALGAPDGARARGGRARPPADRRRGRADVDAAVPRHRVAVADERARRRARRARVLRVQPARAGPGRQAPGRRGRRRLPDARPGRLRPATACGPAAASRTCTATRAR